MFKKKDEYVTKAMVKVVMISKIKTLSTTQISKASKN